MPYKDPAKAKAYWIARNATPKHKAYMEAYRIKRLAWRRSPEGRDIFYGLNIRRLYGITLDEYKALYAAQNGCCAICKRHVSELPRRLGVDHCHKTQRVRGLLCDHCNQAIGKFNDDVKLLHSAAKYLLRQPGGSEDPANTRD